MRRFAHGSRGPRPRTRGPRVRLLALPAWRRAAGEPPSRPGGDRARASRPAGAAQGVDPRGPRSRLLQLRPDRAVARDVRGAPGGRPVVALRALRPGPVAQAAGPSTGGSDAPSARL